MVKRGGEEEGQVTAPHWTCNHWVTGTYSTHTNTHRYVSLHPSVSPRTSAPRVRGPSPFWLQPLSGKLSVNLGPDILAFHLSRMQQEIVSDTFNNRKMWWIIQARCGVRVQNAGCRTWLIIPHVFSVPHPQKLSNLVVLATWHLRWHLLHSGRLFLILRYYTSFSSVASPGGSCEFCGHFPAVFSHGLTLDILPGVGQCSHILIISGKFWKQHNSCPHYTSHIADRSCTDFTSEVLTLNCLRDAQISFTEWTHCFLLCLQVPQLVIHKVVWAWSIFLL